MEDKELAPDGASCVISTQEYLDNLLDVEISIDEKLNALTNEDQQRILLQKLIPTYDTYSGVARASKELRIGVAQNIKEHNKLDPNYKPIERFTTEMGVDGMVHIIRDKGTVDEAYLLVADKHNKPLIDLKEMSTREHYNRHEIIETTEKIIPEQISRITEEGLYPMITNKTTINSMFDNTYTTMKILGELDTLRERVDKLEMRQTIIDTKVNLLESSIEGLNSDKVAAINLKKMGYSNVKIAKELKVSTKTVGRWLKGVVLLDSTSN